MTLEEYISHVEKGSKPRVDFIKKKFYLNRKEVNVEDETTVNNPLEVIESLYQNFKRSYPSDMSCHHMHDYFKALTAEEMTDAEMVNGEERVVARARLEATFLCMVLNGSLTWENNNQWFWKSKNDPDLIILKEWVA